MKSQSFVLGAFILAISNLIVKILGSFFRIPLANMIESDGMGYYQTAYPIYIFLLALSTSGFPIAISKMVAERRKVGQHNNAYKVFKVSMKLLGAMGIVASMFFYFGAGFLAKMLNDENVVYSIKSLSLALLVVPVMAVFKGYFQGRANMVPTSVAQIFEQLIRVFLGLYLAYAFLGKGKPYAAAGASFGASAGGAVALLIMIGIYIKNKKTIDQERLTCLNQEEETTKSIIKEMLYIALPIILGSMVLPLMNFIDSAMVKVRLISAGYTYEEANSLFGQYSGMAMTIINLPQAITLSIATSIVPAISESYAVKDIKKLKQNVVLGTRLTNLIAMPCFAGVMVLATPIMNLLYPKEPSTVGTILLYSSLSIVLVSLIQTFAAILQSVGRAVVPAVNMLVACIFKFFITYFFTATRLFNINGAVLGSVVAFFIACYLDYHYVKKVLKIKFKLRHVFINPLLMSLIMALFVKISYVVFSMFLPSKLVTIIAIMVGMLVYGFELIFMGGISNRELQKLPGGNKILALRKKYQ